MNRPDPRDLHPLIWLWSIPLPLVIHLSARQIDSDNRFFPTWIESESGLIENATALLLLPATVLAIVLAVRCYGQFGRMFSVWFAGFALMCFGFAGEEVSWGQHWLGWSSPEYFAEQTREGVSPRRWSAAIVPTLVCVPAAAFVFGVRLVERCKTWFDLEWSLLDVNLKELQELYIAIFLLIYVWSVYKRYGSASTATT